MRNADRRRKVLSRVRGKVIKGEKMKKKFLVYSLCWFILLALFNVIIFVTPNKIAGASKFSGGFWIGYGFAIAAFIGQLLCAWIAFKANSNRKFFYNFPLITISYVSLVLSAVISIAFLVVPQIPAWIAAIICSIILAFSVIAVIKAKAAAETVASIDEKIKNETSFIRELTAEANSVMYRAQTPEIKKEVVKVYEALRYSDPVSSEQLRSVEAEIAAKFDELTKCVSDNNEAETKAVALMLVNLINERSNKCKLFK